MGRLSCAMHKLAALVALHRSRQALARLDDDQLRDIGLSRADVATELRRPFWQNDPAPLAQISPQPRHQRLKIGK